MKALIIDLQYFPTVNYYLTLLNIEHIIFEQYDHHIKMSFRNRCMIAGANGRIKLSIPLVGGRDQRTISKEVKIDNSVNWQLQHLRSIVSAYNRSPFFEYFSEGFSGLFDKEYQYLLDWNLVCLDWLKESIRGKWTYSLTDKYETDFKNASIFDFRNRFFPRTIQNENIVDLTYRQVFEEKNGFIPQLSILDFLFCSGPQAVISAAGRKTELDGN
ncbi:WbqC family protein [Flavitalea sp.]|nr:WbqC family protein [Flavitalea sp.]